VRSEALEENIMTLFKEGTLFCFSLLSHFSDCSLFCTSHTLGRSRSWL